RSRRFTRLLRVMNITAARRSVAILLTFVICALITGPWAILSARTTAHFGPHTAIVEIDSTHLLDVDLGPLGTVQMPLQRVPAPLGVHVQVEEIESELSAVDKPSTMDDLSQDVQSYAAFFADPDAQIDRAVNDVVQDVVLRWVCGSAGLTLGLLGLYVLVGRRRRRQIAGRLRRRPRVLISGASIATTAAIVVGILGWPPAPPDFKGDSLFDDTPLAGARITGRFSSLVDQLAGFVVSFYDQNEQFYSTALKNLNHELA